MIKIEDLTQHIEDALNASAASMDANFTFKLFTDGGKRASTEFDPYDERDEAERRRTVYGVSKTETSKLLPSKGLKVETITQTVMISVDCSQREPDESGVFPEVEAVRAVIVSAINQGNGETFSQEGDESDDYSVTLNYSPVTVGQRDYASVTAGVLIPLYFSAFYTAVGGGVSANDVRVFVDNKEVLAQQIVFTRTRLANQYATESGEAETAILQSGFGVDMTVPLLTANAADLLPLIMEDDRNRAHMVVVEYPTGGAYAYICVSGQGSGTLIPGSNVGLALSFAQGVEDVMEFGDEWKEVEAYAHFIGSEKVLTCGPIPENVWVIFPEDRVVYSGEGGIVSVPYDSWPKSLTVRWYENG